MPGLPLFAGLRLRVLRWKEQELGKEPQRAQTTERRGEEMQLPPLGATHHPLEYWVNPSTKGHFPS